MLFLRRMENKPSSNCKQDKSDRKATDMLINALFSKNVTPPKLKQSSLDKYWSNSPGSIIPKDTKKNIQLRRQKHAKKLSNVSSKKLTSLGWLNMSSRKDNVENRNDHNRLCDNQTRKVDESTKKITTEAHATDINTPETLGKLCSCKEHGTETYEELLEEIMINEQGKKCLRSIVYGGLKQLPDITELGVEDLSSYVDCTHLSLAQIEQAFKDNIEYISRVNDRQIESQTHKRILDMNLRNISRGNVSRIVSMIVFTNEQKQVLSSLLYEKFGQVNDNYFKVLMPELCMKIFMDVFNMSYEEAYEYLKERPVKM